MNNGRNRECEICKEKGTNICYDCLSYYCNSCFNFVHEKLRNLFHETEDFESFNSIDIKCPKHPKNLINLFCFEEKRKI